MMDLMIPGIEGPDTMKSILEKGLNKVILLSGMENYHAAQRYLKAGAVGFLPKSIITLLPYDLDAAKRRLKPNHHATPSI